MYKKNKTLVEIKKKTKIKSFSGVNTLWSLCKRMGWWGGGGGGGGFIEKKKV
jgi:hypothetical protein